jgi:hypothetical protein
MVAVKLRRGPVTDGGSRTIFVKSADVGTIIEQHTQLTLRQRAPVPVAVCVEHRGVFLRFIEAVRLIEHGLPFTGGQCTATSDVARSMIWTAEKIAPYNAYGNRITLPSAGRSLVQVSGVMLPSPFSV